MLETLYHPSRGTEVAHLRCMSHASNPKENSSNPHHAHGHDEHSHHDSSSQRSPHEGHGAARTDSKTETSHEGHSGDHEKHGGHASHHQHMVIDFKKRFFVSLAVTIPIMALSPMIQHFLGVREAFSFAGSSLILLTLSSFVYFYGGWPFLKGLREEVRGKNPGMMTLIAVAISAAYFYSAATVFGLSGEDFFWELATLIDIMLLGHWIEMRSVMGASRALEALVKLMPSDAHLLLEGGRTQDVPLDSLTVGAKVVVKPGEKIPADGKVIEGKSSVNESMLTGESKPVSKGPGQTAIGGAINGTGSLVIEVTRTGKDSYLQQVITLVQEAQESKSKTQDLANRAARWLTLLALGGSALTFLIWWFFGGQSLAFAIERAVTVAVITCPHALGVAVPLVVAVSTALAAQRGFLIRDRAAFEKARGLQAIVFDKTGTLTFGKFGVTDTIIYDKSVDEKRLLTLAASLEAKSEHPIAQSIAEAVQDKLDIQDFQSIPGKGVQGTIEGKKIRIVSPGALRELGFSAGVEDPRFLELSKQGKTVVFVLQDEALIGAIALADLIRPESRAAMERLRSMGIRCIMLTGDNAQVAAWVAKEVGLDEVIAEVLPHQKSEKIAEIQRRGLVVGMTGDGVNDAPALAVADVGIAIGAGTDVAIETADIVLVRSNPMDVASVVELSRATYRKMIQNLFWATGYNAVAIPLAAGALYSQGLTLSPAMGAVLMSVSTVVVAINARLLRLN